MAFFFLTVFIGNIFDTYVNDSIQSGGFFSQFKHACQYFWLFTGIMVANMVLYYLAIYLLRKIRDTAYVDDPSQLTQPQPNKELQEELH